MPPLSDPWPSRREWLLIVSAWLVVGLLNGMEDVLDGRGGGIVWGRLPAAVGEEMIEYSLWIVVTPLVFWLARRFPLERAYAMRHAALHLSLAVVAAVLIDVADTVLHDVLLHDSGRSAHASFLRIVTQFWFTNELIIYIVVLAAGVARDNFLQKKHQQQEAKQLQIRTQQLERQLTEARLQTLRMQLNPHFLFNTLHAISTLVGRDPKGVRRMVTRLSELLRRVLDEDAPQDVPLAEELDALRDYLAIQHIRFQDRLDITIDVPDGLHAARVPYLILQPLAENAIKHGVSRTRGNGHIALQGHRDGDRLVLRLRDNGPGLGEWIPGTGIRNVRDRLTGLYGSEAHLRLDDGPDGTVATLVVPYHTQADVYVPPANSSPSPASEGPSDDAVSDAPSSPHAPSHA
mgnify:CR=1 FL=1